MSVSCLLAAVVDADRAVATVEPGSAEVRFKHADAMGDSGTGASVPERGVSMWSAKGFRMPGSGKVKFCQQ